MRFRKISDGDKIFHSEDDEERPTIKVKRKKSISKNKHKKGHSKIHQLIFLYKKEIRHSFKEKKFRNLHKDELMNRANKNYLDNNYDEVIKDCYELILKNPNAADPYNLLHLVYEELGDLKKSTDFLLVKTKLSKIKHIDI